MGKSAKKKRLRESTSAGDNGIVDNMISSSSSSASAGGGSSSAPSTPIKGASNHLHYDDDDPLLWSKSKRKRMRQKAKKLSMTIAGVLGDPIFPSSGRAIFDDEVDDGNKNNGNNKKRERNAEYDRNNDNNGADDSDKKKKKRKKRMDSNSNNSSSIMVQLPKIQPSNEKVDIDGDNGSSSPKKKGKKNKKKMSNSTAATNNDYTNTNTGADDIKRHDEFNDEDVWRATTATPGGDKNCNNAHQTSASSVTDNGNGRSCSPKRKKDKKNKDHNDDNDKKQASLSSPSSPRRGASPLSIGMDGEIILSPQLNNNHKSSMSNNSQSTIHISIPITSQMSTLQRDFLDRLTSSRFRELNEELYTQSSSTSYDTFTKSPELFDQYHVGFRKQVQSWPVNPVNVIYKKIINVWTKDRQQQQQSSNDDHTQTKQRNNSDSSTKIVVADFGCGDAKLAERLLALWVGGKDGNSLEQQSSSMNKKKSMMTTTSCPFVVHSFDLVSGGNPLVTPADMSNVPLANETVDVAVYSLALMGTNVADFVREAWRVLKFNGVLRVAEVRSRFETTASAATTTGRGGGGSSPAKYDKSIKRGKLNNGGVRQHSNKLSNAKMNNNNADDSPKPLMLLDEFISLLERCGFQCTNMDRSNKMFLFMDFVKQDGSYGLSDKETFTAKACIYKKR